MLFRFSKHIVFTLLFVSHLSNFANAQSDDFNKHTMVSMRMIGHEILLLNGDSSSRVLPISNTLNQYKIEFSSGFQFQPEEISFTIDSIISYAKIAEDYIVEILQCNTNEVVYSYEIRNSQSAYLVPCVGRTQPLGCYYITINILELSIPFAPISKQKEKSPNKVISKTRSKEYATIALVVSPIFALLGLLVVLRKKNKTALIDPDLIVIGEFLFDERNMTILHNNQIKELTAKESGLLFLLHENVNNTVEREHILKEVWGDEGDYIGRTLDVYISKLRKKLEADNSIKIINIRGVGYKLIIDR